MCWENLGLDRSRRITIRRGKEIPLTWKQFELVETLIPHAGVITTREQLIEAGWGFAVDVKENTLDVYIHGPRSKPRIRAPFLHDGSRFCSEIPRSIRSRRY
jgi:DNA-binding response OmpR family regulator